MGHARKNIQSRPLMYTLLWNFPVSPGRNFFLYPPSSPASPHLFLFPRIQESAYSPLPYNRLINQYNIFTERDSSERYCQYRETLSKASPAERGKEEKPKWRHRVPSSFFPPSLQPPSPLLPSSPPIRLRVHKRRERNSARPGKLSEEIGSPTVEFWRTFEPLETPIIPFDKGKIIFLFLPSFLPFDLFQRLATPRAGRLVARFYFFGGYVVPPVNSSVLGRRGGAICM